MTCNSFIAFATSDTPVVIRILTNGLKTENPDQPVVKWLEVQLADMKTGPYFNGRIAGS